MDSTQLNALISTEISQFKQGANAWDREISDTQIEQLVEYCEVLMQWNQRMNLVGNMLFKELVVKHIMDSLALLSYVNPLQTEGWHVLDFGTGAGLPGIPLAIMMPEVHFDLLDARSRRIEFVRFIAGKLKLSNVDMFAARGESFVPKQKYQQIVTRAVASVDNIIKLTSHCMEDKGQWLIMKGLFPEKELAEISHEQGQYKVELLSIKNMEEQRHVVIIDAK